MSSCIKVDAKERTCTTSCTRPSNSHSPDTMEKSLYLLFCKLGTLGLGLASKQNLSTANHSCYHRVTKSMKIPTAQLVSAWFMRSNIDVELLGGCGSMHCAVVTRLGNGKDYLALIAYLKVQLICIYAIRLPHELIEVKHPLHCTRLLC